MVPHLTGRPATRKRWPDGVTGEAFFVKQVEAGIPVWLSRVQITHRRAAAFYPVLDTPAALAWLGQVAALEVHVPQWRIPEPSGPGGAAGRAEHSPDRVVFDLDPGEGAGLAECVHVALALRERLGALGSRMVPVTSGSKGLHLYVPMDQPITSEQASDWARLAAEELQKALPTYLHRTDTATWPFRQTSDPDRRSGADLNPLGCSSPDSCRIPRAGRGVKGRVAPAERRRRRP